MIYYIEQPIHEKENIYIIAVNFMLLEFKEPAGDQKQGSFRKKQ